MGCALNNLHLGEALLMLDGQQAPHRADHLHIEPLFLSWILAPQRRHRDAHELVVDCETPLLFWLLLVIRILLFQGGLDERFVNNERHLCVFIYEKELSIF